jgi:GT2 family glycosyltransferase
MKMGDASMAAVRPDCRSPDAQAPKVTVVIPNYNGRHLLETCVPTVFADLRGDVGAEVIVVDNDSNDESVAWLRSNWPQVTVIKVDRNRGFAVACNIGAKSSRSPIVIFHNNDAIVRPGWSAALRVALESAPDIVIAGGLTLFLDRPHHVNSAGIRIAISGAAVDVGFDRPLAEVDLSERDIAGVSGVSMAVSRAWFEAVGGFDEDFVMYFEDADLCLRAWIAGRRVRFTPDAVVMHAFGGTSGDRYVALRNYYGSRNRLLMAAKSFGIGRLIAAVGLSVAEDLAVVAWLLATGEFERARAAADGKLRGTFDGVRAIPSYLRGSRRAARSRGSMRELRAFGVIDPLGVSLREFAHMRLVGRRQ